MVQIHQLCTRKDQEKKSRVCLIFKIVDGKEVILSTDPGGGPKIKGAMVLGDGQKYS